MKKEIKFKDLTRRIEVEELIKNGHPYLEFLNTTTEKYYGDEPDRTIKYFDCGDNRTLSNIMYLDNLIAKYYQEKAKLWKTWAGDICTYEDEILYGETNIYYKNDYPYCLEVIATFGQEPIYRIKLLSHTTCKFWDSKGCYGWADGITRKYEIINDRDLILKLLDKVDNSNIYGKIHRRLVEEFRKQI